MADAETVRQQVIDFWVNQGLPQHVAEGIADRVKVESGFNPLAIGDQGTSGGLYQHHATRLSGLKSFAENTGKAWTDPQVQNEFALQEVKGGDSIAAKHWEEIANAPDRKTAELLWTKYFERPKIIPGGALGAVQGIASPQIPAETNELAARLVPRVYGLAPQTGSAQVPGALAGLGQGPWARLLGLSLLAQSTKPLAPAQIKYDPRKGVTTAEQVAPPKDLPALTGTLPGTTLIPTVDYNTGQESPQRRSLGISRNSGVGQYLTRIGMKGFWAGEG